MLSIAAISNTEDLYTNDKYIAGQMTFMSFSMIDWQPDGHSAKVLIDSQMWNQVRMQQLAEARLVI